MELLGIDAGWSTRRPTCGLAYLRGEELITRHLYEHELQKAIPAGAVPDVAAIDAPLLADSAHRERACESFFIRGPFQRRCKPGLSHVPGTEQRLREAGRTLGRLAADFAPERQLATEIPRIAGCGNVVEAFPNAFLGVVIEDGKYAGIVGPPRGEKFNRLYEAWIESGHFEGMARVRRHGPRSRAPTFARGVLQVHVSS